MAHSSSTPSAPSLPPSPVGVKDFDIDAYEIGVYRMAMAPLVKSSTKAICCITWTLSIEGNDYLNRLTKRGIDVMCIAAVTTTDRKAWSTLYKLKIRDYIHTKLWIIDDAFFIGSSNLVNDTIANVMVRVTSTEHKKYLERAFKEAWTGFKPKTNRTHILL